jgi:Domain of unknown function (DUF2828)
MNGTMRGYTRPRVINEKSELISAFEMESKKSSLLDAMEKKTTRRAASNMTRTENSAVTYKSTKSALLDFFSVGGALRTRTDAEIVSLFRKAIEEDAGLALKALFYFRDVRGGQGERKVFRVLAKFLAEQMPYYITKNMKFISEFGRWDDMFALVGTRVETLAFAFMKDQLVKDVDAFFAKQTGISLLAKWLPSENTSSKKTRSLATRFRVYLGWTPRDYRTTLADLRGYIKLVEREMSAGHWTSIDYEKVPSRASMIYRKAFGRHNPDGYGAYIKSVQKGEKKIHAATLYPYDLVNIALYQNGDATIDAQWKALPNYVPEGGNALVIADTSGSMSGLPMAISVSIAMYFAERNTGIFKDYFLTFSAKPTLQKLVGSTLTQKAKNLSRANWDQNTDVQSAFDLILNTAVKNRIPESDMPKKLFIVSDMEFDAADGRNRQTNFQAIQSKYRAAGYKMPVLVFWNVQSRHNQSPVTVDDRGVVLVSGCSPSIFKSVMESRVVTPYDMMLEVLMQERYAGISVN